MKSQRAQPSRAFTKSITSLRLTAKNPCMVYRKRRNEEVNKGGEQSPPFVSRETFGGTQHETIPRIWLREYGCNI